MAAIQLDDTAMKAMMSAAILSMLTDERKTVILQGAIENLLAPQETGGYNNQRRPSLIQQAFNDALRDVTYRVAVEMVKDDPVIRGKIRELITQAAEKAMAEPDKLVDKLASTITTALCERTY